MAIDFDLLDAAIGDAATGAHGFQHNQGSWLMAVPDASSPSGESCGTAMCLAGFAALRAGAEAPPTPRRSPEGRWFVPQWFVDPETGRLSDLPGSLHVSDYAERALGLSPGQAVEMFSAANTLDDIKRMRDELLERPHASGNRLAYVRRGDNSW